MAKSIPGNGKAGNHANTPDAETAEAGGAEESYAADVCRLRKITLENKGFQDGDIGWGQSGQQWNEGVGNEIKSDPTPPGRITDERLEECGEVRRLRFPRRKKGRRNKGNRKRENTRSG
jgi:hypothetical protein